MPVSRVEEAAARLRDDVDDLALGGKVAYAYNPLRYAWAPHAAYARTYGKNSRRAILVGMNPGPWGMGQTGIPFGDVKKVRDWMDIEAPVGQPPHLHPKRPVTGFACTRSEPSGTRLYSWAEAQYGAAAAFFDTFYVVNYCPLLMFTDEGKNLTPADLPVAQKQAIVDVCDPHLGRIIEALEPRFVIGVGQYAAAQAERVVDGMARDDVTVGSVLHPSPANPQANRGWAQAAQAQLEAMGVL